MSEYIGTRYLPDDLTVSTGSTRLSGWEAVSVTRGVERFPSTFEIATSDYDPDSATRFKVLPGDSCTVQLGDDTVLTGYVERILFRVSAGRPEIVVGAGARHATCFAASISRVIPFATSPCSPSPRISANPTASVAPG